MKSNKYQNYIKKIKSNGFVLIPNFLSKNKVIKLKKLVNYSYNKDKKRKNPTFNLHKNKDKTVYNLQNKDYEFIKIFSNKTISSIAKYFFK